MLRRKTYIKFPKKINFKNRDVKIIKAISAIVILSLSIIIMLGILAVYYMGKINNNGQKIYSTYLQKIIQLDNIKNNVTEINSSLDALYRTANNEVYMSSSTNIDSNMDKIKQTYLKNYKSKISDKNENSMFEAFNTKLNDITTGWNTIKKDYSSTQQISKDKVSIIRSEGKDLSNDITSLVMYNEQLSGKMNDSNIQIFNANKIVFIIIFSSAFIVLLLMFLFIVKFIKESVLNMNKILKDISIGDFTVSIDSTGNSEFGHMKGELKKTLSSLSSIFSNIKEAASNINDKAVNLSAISEEMSSSTGEVAASVQDVSKDATNQAGELADTNKVIDDFSTKIDNITTDITNVDEKSKQISEMAKAKNADMKMVVGTVGELNDVFLNIKAKIAGLSNSINKIGEITGVINSIAKQTNLLSLNAAIEAARAGEAGKGFAVVADEVRKLAEQSSSSSHSINKLIESISKESSTVVNSTEELSSKFKNQINVIKGSIDSYMDIVKSLEEMMPKIGSINDSANEINRSKKTLLNSIQTTSAEAQNISASSEEIASSVEEMSASSKDTADTAQYLSGLTENMMKQINKFKF